LRRQTAADKNMITIASL